MRGHIAGETRATPHRGRGQVITSPLAWNGRTQDNHPLERRITSIVAGTPPGPVGEEGDVIYNDGGALAGQPVWQFGYWAPITNGDPDSPELLFDSAGASVVGFVPTP